MSCILYIPGPEPQVLDTVQNLQGGDTFENLLPREARQKNNIPVQSNSQGRTGDLQPVKHSALAPTRPGHRAPDLGFFFPIHPPSCCSHCYTLTSALFFLSRNKGM